MRRNLQRYLAGLILIVLVFPAPAIAEICRFVAGTAFDEAREQGFSFRLREGNPDRCRMRGVALIVSASHQEPAECEFVLMGGKGLMPGWSIRNLAVSGETLLSEQASGGQPGWVIRIRAPQMLTRTVSVRRLILNGPKCDDFRKPFG